MKKIISLILAVLMLLGVLPLSTMAEEEEPYEVIKFNGNTSAESENFLLSCESATENGWEGGSDFFYLTISSKSTSEYIIKRIEATVGPYYGKFYPRVGVRPGTKRENRTVYEGDIVHVDDIHSPSFSFAGGSDFIYFKDITVYYEENTDTTKEYLRYSGQTTAESKNYTLLADSCSSDGWRGGNDLHFITVSAKPESGLQIESIEARISYYGDSFGGVGISGGKKRENGKVKNGTTVHIDDIHAESFSFSGGSDFVNIDDITVHVEPAESKKDAETIRFNGQKNAESNNFSLTAMSVGDSGWYGGGNNENLTISAKENSGLQISSIEAVIGYFGRYYNNVGVSAGKKREEGAASNGAIVHIDDIHSDTFSFKDGSEYVQFRDITVYYEPDSSTSGAAFGEGSGPMIAIGCAAVVVLVAVAVAASKKKKK